MIEDEILTKADVLKYLKISHATLQELMREREIPYSKLKRKVLFKKSDIDAFLESKKVK